MSAVIEASSARLRDIHAELVSARRSRRRRAMAVASALAAVAFAALVAQIFMGGSADIAVGDALRAAVGQGEGLARFVVWETRMPRALVAAGVGVLFGLSGALYQRLFSNVLATPDIIGVSTGASAGAVTVLVVGAGMGLAVQAGAIVGALVAVALIFGLSWRKGSSTYRLILIGIAASASFASLTSFLLTYADSATTMRAMRWLIGSLSTALWPDVPVVAITAVVGLIAVRFLLPSLTTLEMGDPLAAGLGVRVNAVKIGALLLGAVLAAIATSTVGPIAFIALLSAPLAHRLVRHAGPFMAALVGATLLSVADVAAQTAPFISPIPTGVLTGLIGAPLLMFFLLSKRTDTR